MKMIKKFGKRSLATILAFMMCLGLMTTTAFAAEDDFTVTLTSNKSTVSAGDSIQYTLTVKNNTTNISWVSVEYNFPHVYASSQTSSFSGMSGNSYKLEGRKTGSITWTGTVEQSAMGDMNPSVTVTADSFRKTATTSVQGPTGVPATDVNFTFNDIALDEPEKQIVIMQTAGNFSYATLEPKDTTDSIANIVWTSANEGIVSLSKMSGSGSVRPYVVTAVATGSTTLTATVTTINGKTFTKEVSVTVGEPMPVVPQPETYTFTIAEATGKETVNVGDTVTMNVTLDKPASIAEAVVTYDETAFELQGDDSQLTISKYSLSEDTAENEILATLTFKAIAATEEDAEFGFSAAKAALSADIPDGEAAPEATKVSAQITVTNAPVKVTFVDGETSTEVEVPYGETLTGKVPTPAGKDYHDFDSWKNGDVTLDENAPVTAPVTYTAVYTPKTYNVTVGEGLTGETTATYGTAYTGTIKDFDGDNYTYTVKYTIDGTEAEATVDAEGNYTIAGENITGNMEITVEETPAFQVEVHEDYITGHTLVLVKPSSSEATEKGYTYGDANMYFVTRYGAYGWIVEGGLTVDQAKAQINVGTTSGDVLDRGTDVNSSGNTDIYDTAAVIGCYRVQYDLATNMARYLSADVSGDNYKVDVNDVAAVQAAYSTANP